MTGQRPAVAPLNADDRAFLRGLANERGVSYDGTIHDPTRFAQRYLIDAMHAGYVYDTRAHDVPSGSSPDWLRSSGYEIAPVSFDRLLQLGGPELPGFENRPLVRFDGPGDWSTLRLTFDGLIAAGLFCPLPSEVP